MYYEDTILFLKILFKVFLFHTLWYTQKTLAIASLHLSEANSHHSDQYLVVPLTFTIWLRLALTSMLHFSLNFSYSQSSPSTSCLAVNLTPFRHKADTEGRQRTGYDMPFPSSFMAAGQERERVRLWCLACFWSSGTLITVIHNHAVWLKEVACAIPCHLHKKM